MNENQMQNLLKQADRHLAAPPHADPAAVAARAVRRAARQSRTQTVLVSAVVGLLILTAALAGYTRHQHRQRRDFEARMQAQLTQLKTEARQTLTLVRQANAQLELQQKDAQLQILLASIETRAQAIESRSEQLAAKLYEKAKTLAADRATCPIAETLYQRIVQTFPETNYAPLAKQALAQLDCSTTPQS